MIKFRKQEKLEDSYFQDKLRYEAMQFCQCGSKSLGEVIFSTGVTIEDIDSIKLYLCETCGQMAIMKIVPKLNYMDIRMSTTLESPTIYRNGCGGVSK